MNGVKATAELGVFGTSCTNCGKKRWGHEIKLGCEGTFMRYGKRCMQCGETRETRREQSAECI